MKQLGKLAQYGFIRVQDSFAISRKYEWIKRYTLDGETCIRVWRKNNTYLVSFNSTPHTGYIGSTYALDKYFICKSVNGVIKILRLYGKL